MTPIQNLLAARARAAARGDLNVVFECNRALDRSGYVETAEQHTAPEDTASPRPRRGRPPKTAA